MKPQRRHDHGTAVAIVTRVRYALKVYRSVHSAPDLERIVGFYDSLSRIVQLAIPKQNALSTQSQVFTMIARESIRDKRGSQLVILPVPQSSSHIEPSGEGLV